MKSGYDGGKEGNGLVADAATVYGMQAHAVHPCYPNINPNVRGQEVDDLATEVAAVACVLGLDVRVTQELVSLQPRRAAWGLHSNPDLGCAWGSFNSECYACMGLCCCGPGALSWVFLLVRLPWAAICWACLGLCLAFLMSLNRLPTGACLGMIRYPQSA